MALQSQLFRGDLKLDAAAVSDPAHILPGAREPHVGKIQQALIKLDGAAIAQDSAYGPATAAAVSAFKQKRQILNFQGKIDNIVGKKTMAALDSEMLAKERGGGGGGGRLGFKIVGDDTPSVGRGLPLDIFVFFEGGDKASEGNRKTTAETDFKRKFNTAAYLKTHQEAVPFHFVGGRDGTDRSQEVADQVFSLRIRNPAGGVTVIVGSSVGAVPALNCARLLTAKRVSLNYVAINDGAFFADRGEVTFSPFTNLMSGGIVAFQKDNFFQTFGHELLSLPISDPRGRFGFMIGTEFHGPLETSYNNVDIMLTPGGELFVQQGRANLLRNIAPLPVLKRFGDGIHQAAANQTDPVIETKKEKLFVP